MQSLAMSRGHTRAALYEIVLQGVAIDPPDARALAYPRPPQSRPAVSPTLDKHDLGYLREVLIPDLDTDDM
jgi:hypothetical protein